MKVLKITAILICIVIVFSFCGCIFQYSEDVYVNGLNICYNSFFRVCFAANYDWNGDENNMTINIPDSYNGYKLTSLGGYYGKGAPTPFCVNLPDSFNINGLCTYSVFENYLNENDNVIVNDLYFTINIGKNISAVQLAIFDDCQSYINTDGKRGFYRFISYINCSEENKTFYSEDGKLYYKADNTLVKGFNYADD